jgi:hypothetical protein
MNLKTTLTALALLWASLSFAQSFNTDVVYLKNGSIIRGVIIEQVPNQSLKIQTQDKSVFVYRYEEIEKIIKELPQADQAAPKRIRKPKYKADSSASNTQQGKIFFNINVGYGLSAVPQLLDNNSNVINGDFLSEGVYGTFGRGFLTNVRFGYALGNHVAFDAGLSYLIGQAVTSKSISQNSNTERSRNAFILNANPALILMHQHNNLGIYARSGMMLGLSENLTYEEKRIYTNFNGIASSETRTVKYFGGISWGFSSALGLTYKINPNVSIVSELNLITQNWAPRKSIVTEYTVDGIDKLYTLPNKEITYYGSGSNNSSSFSNYKNYLPLSSISFNAGIRFEL